MLTARDFEDLRREVYDIREKIQKVETDHAQTREAVRIYTEIVEDIKDDLENLKNSMDKMYGAFVDHTLSETRDRRGMLIGLVTSVASTVGTLGILVWAIVINNGQLP